MNTPQVQGSPEFQSAYAEWASLYRNGFRGTPEIEIAMLRMVELAPDEVIHQIVEKARQAGLMPADMPIGASAEDCAQVASIEAIAKAMRKGGAS